MDSSLLLPVERTNHPRALEMPMRILPLMRAWRFSRARDDYLP